MPVIPEGTPYTCNTEMILFSGRPSERYSISLITGASTDLGPLTPASSVNAIGYNVLDNFIYGYDQTSGTLVGVNADGEVTYLGPRPAGMPAAAYSAGTLDFNGYYYVYAPGTGRFYTIDLRPGSPTYLRLVDPRNGYQEQTSDFGVPLIPPLTIGDWAFNPMDGFLYGVEQNGLVYRIETGNGQAVPLETTGPNPGSVFGSAVIDGSGKLYAVNNSDGTIYRYTILGDTAAGTRFSVTQTDAFSDAALCPYAIIELDFGDAPDAGSGGGAGNYNTMLSSNGPRHGIINGLYLGTQITAEEDAYANPTATGDDLTQGIQDDGVPVPLPLLSVNDTTYSLTVTVTNYTGTEAYLYGWVDFNKNGLFEASEASAVLTVPGNSGVSQQVLTFSRAPEIIPGPGHTFLRLRLTTELLTDTGTEAQDTRSVGPAIDGEVEDYILNIGTVSDLSVTKTADIDVLNTGDTIRYTITVQNNSPEEALNVVLTDIIPPEITAPIYSIDGGPQDYWPGSIALGNMAPGQVITVEIQGVFDGSTLGPVINTAVITSSSEDPNPDNNSSTVTTPVNRAANLAIEKTTDAVSAVVGEYIVYTITVVNNGPDEAVNTIITDIPEADLAAPEYSTDGGNTWYSWTGEFYLGTLPPGGVFSFELRGTAEAGMDDDLTNTASVTSDTDDPDPSDNTSTVTVPKEHSADLSVTKTAEPDPVSIGQTVTYTLVVSNSGPSPADDVLLTDILPPELSDAEYSFDLFSWYPWTGSLLLGALDPGQIRIIYIRSNLSPDTAADILLNTAEVTSPTPDPYPDNNSFTTVTPVEALADLEIVKYLNTDSPVAGEPIIYTLKIINNGPAAAADVEVSDYLPAEIFNAEYYFNGSYQGPWYGSVVIGTLAAFESVEILITGILSPSAFGILYNSASVQSSTPDPDYSNNTSDTASEIIGTADISVVKSASPDPAVPGQYLTYTIAVSNAGPSASENVTVTDQIPDSLENPEISVDGQTWLPWDGTYNIGTLEPGNTVFIYFRGTVAPSAAADIVNTVSVTSDTPDPNPDNNSYTTTTPADLSADLSVTKSASPDPAVPGSLLTYTLTVYNDGPSDAQNTELADAVSSLLANVRYSLNQGGTWEVWNGTLPLGTIEAGSSLTVLIQGTVSSTAAGTISNTAVISSTTPDPDPDNNTATIITPVLTSADLSVTKTAAPDPAVTGQLLTYTITVRNAGPDTAAGTVLTDSLPPDLIQPEISADGGNTWNDFTTPYTIGDLAGGAETVILLRGILADTASGTLANTVSVTSQTPDPDPDNNSFTLLTPVELSADISITKSVSPSPAVPGSLIVYTLTITNAGPDTAAGVVVTDTIPAQVLNPEYSLNGGNYAPWEGQLDIGSLPAGQSAAVTIRGTVSPSADGTILNQAEAASPTPDPDPDNNNAAVETPLAPSADLSITKTGAPNPAVPGETVTYTLTVYNAGPSDARNILVIDAVSDMLMNVTVLPEGETQPQPWTGEYSIADLASGASFTLTIQGRLSPSAVGNLVNTAAAASSTPDPDPSNNHTTEELPIEASADLAVRKSASPNPVIPGQYVTYILTASNAGPSGAENVVLSDTLPAQLINQEFSTDGGNTWNSWNGSYTAGPLAAGASVTILLRGLLPVSENLPDTLTNTAEVSSNTPDPDPDNNTSEIVTPVSAAADLSIVKEAYPSPAVPGKILTYTLTVSNLGPAAARNILVTDAISGQLSGVEFSADQGMTWTPWTSPYRIDSLDAGSAALLYVRGTLNAAAAGTIVNTAVVTSSTPDPNPDNNTAIEETPVQESADLSITKIAHPVPAVPGQYLTFTLLASNAGPADAFNVILTDPIQPAEYSADGGLNWKPWTGSFGAGTISASSAIQIIIRTLLPADASGIFSNTAAIVSDTPDPNPDNNTTTVETPIAETADLSIQKTADTEYASPGDVVTYQLVIRNLGTVDALDVNLRDSLPEGLENPEISADGGSSWSPYTSPYALGTVTNQETRTLLIRGTVTAAEDSIINTAYLLSSTPDPDYSNNSDTAVVGVGETGGADLMILKTACHSTVCPCESARFIITVINQGPETAYGTVVTDLLPDELSNARFSVDGGNTWSRWSGELHLGNLAKGSSSTFLLTANVNRCARGTITNEAIVSSSAYDPNPDNNRAASCIKICRR